MGIVENALRHRPEVLSSLIRIGNVFNTERNFDHLLNVIVNEVIQILEAERGSIFLLDEKKDEIWSRVATGLHREEIIRAGKSEGIVGRVITTGQALNIPDAYADPRFNPEIDKRTGYHTRTILCVPLITMQGKIIGAFQVLNKHAPPFTDADEDILRMVSSQACIALENAQLYKELVAHKDTLHEENLTLKRQLKGKYAYPTIIGDSPAIQTVKTFINKVSTTDANVLITGESGTGKELIARAIHSQSRRATKPIIAINCAALNESLLESELFGIEEGVATGVSKRIGYLEQADGGTIFLDEVGDMSLSTQSKMLRAIQERTIQRIGSKREVAIDIRIVCATNRDLVKAIREERFREDLFYRLNSFPIHLPPLRERVQDIPLLANFVLANVVQKMNLAPKVLSRASVEAMLSYGWPGNVREMENVIERAVILSEGHEIDLQALIPSGGAPPEESSRDADASVHLPPFSHAEQPALQTMELRGAVELLERRMIAAALEQTSGNQVHAAKMLGISREGLRKKLERYQLKSTSP